MFNFLIIILFAGYVFSYEPFENQMCDDESSSCENKFGSQLYNDACQKINHKLNNQTVCDSVYDEDDTSLIRDTDLGKLILSPIYGDRRTIFNITFVDIKFQKLKIRFQEYIDTNKVLDKCMIKEFVFTSAVTSEYIFSYVCPWSDSSFEGHEVELHYDYGIKEYETRRKYKFKVPEYNSLMENNGNMFFFAYVDYTDLSNLVLHINPAQNKFNITKYKVFFIKIYDNETTILSSVNLTSAANSQNFFTYSNTGYYYFRIEPISSYCKINKLACFVTETPKILIAPLTSSFLIGMVGVSLLIPVFVVIIYMWTKKWPGLPRPKPKVLLVTFPTNNAHIILVPSLAEFLRETCNIQVMLDVIDIPKTIEKNSFHWLKIAVKNATHIVYLRSNNDLRSDKVIYTDIYLQTINLLDPKFNPKRKKECVLSFPYSSAITDFTHPELAHIDKRFHFNNLNKFIKYLTNKNIILDRNNQTYLKLLEAVHNVENEPVSKNQKTIEVKVQVIDETNEYCGKQNIETDYSENENIDLDLSDFNLLGESGAQFSDKNDSYSDIDELIK